jgi:hypothetical protein
MPSSGSYYNKGVQANLPICVLLTIIKTRFSQNKCLKYIKLIVMMLYIILTCYNVSIIAHLGCQLLVKIFWYYTGLFKMIVGVWPPRSPDATPFDFFLWGYVKDQVYVPPLPASIPELKVRVRTAIETITADMQTVWNELVYRVDVCRITKGAHIEHR